MDGSEASANPRPRLPPDRVSPWLPLLPALAVFLASLAAALHAALRLTGGRLIYALDDAYIHMAVARTLALHGVWGCTPFHFSSSSSSLLWTFLLGVAYRVFGVHDSLPLLLNVLFAVASLVVADRALGRLGVRPVLRATALVAIVVAFPLAGMVLIGMEHVLHLLLTISFAAVAVDALTASGAPPVRTRRTVALCVLGALLATSRYEGLFLVALVSLAFAVRRQLARAAAIGLASLLPVVAFGAISVANGAYFLPNPLMVKAVGETESTVSAILKPFGSEDLEFLKNNRAMPILLVLGVLAALASWRARRSFWRPAVVLPLLLAAMIAVHGHFVFSPLYWAYRYDAYLVGFGLFVAAVLLAEMPLGRPALAPILLAVLVPVLADVREGLYPTAEVEGIRGTYLEQYQTAQFIQRYYPNDAVIVNDLGAVTYYTHARILDLVGLGDIEPLAIMRRSAYTGREVTEWTAPYRPRIAVVSLGWSIAGALVPREWVRVAVVEVPPHWHRVGFFAVDPKGSWVLRGSVAQHYAPLERTLGHRLKLRRAEGVDAALDPAPPGEAGGASPTRP
jgi:hypothetical protein